MSASACLPRRTLPLALLLLAACNGSESPAASGAPPPAAVDHAAFEAARQKAVKLQDSGAEQQKVLDALLAAHVLDPAHVGINRRLGQAYVDLRLHEQALEAYKRVLAVQPDDRETLLAVATLQVRLSRPDEALAALAPLLDDPQLAGEARYQKALVLDQQGRRAEAEALVADTAGLAPRIAYRCRSLHGRYLSENGDWAGAAEEFARALAGRADYKEALRGAADCARRRGQADEAARWDERLSLIVELTDNVYMKSAKAAPQRRALLERLVADYPDWGGAFLELADLQQRAGDSQAACHTVEAYLAAHGADVPADQHAPLRKRFCGSGS